MLYGQLLKEILDYNNTDTTYHMNKETSEFKKINSGDKIDYEMNLWSFKLRYLLELRHIAKKLPRKKKKRLALHFNKKYNKIKKTIDKDFS